MATGRLAFGFDGEIGTNHHIKVAAGHRARHGDHRPETISIGVAVVSVRAVGWLIAKVGQPRVMGEIVAGILLGPSLLGLVWPEALESSSLPA